MYAWKLYVELTRFTARRPKVQGFITSKFGDVIDARLPTFRTAGPVDLVSFGVPARRPAVIRAGGNDTLLAKRSFTTWA